MADFSSAASSLQTSLEAVAAKNGVQEYQIGNLRTRYASPLEMVKALSMAEALANRGSTPFAVAKFGRVR